MWENVAQRSPVCSLQDAEWKYTAVWLACCRLSPHGTQFRLSALEAETGQKASEQGEINGSSFTTQSLNLLLPGRQRISNLGRVITLGGSNLHILQTAVSHLREGCVCVCRGALPIGRGSDMHPKCDLNCAQHTEACDNKTGTVPLGKVYSAATADQRLGYTEGS